MNKITNSGDKEPAPFFGSWNKIYALIFGNLVFLVVIFYIFTKVFE